MFRTALFILLTTLFALPGVSDAQSQNFNDLPLLQLERQLNAILKTRLPEEKKFIAAVVKQVKDDKLPRRLVNTSFKYVRNKRAGTKYPFVYFVRVLQFQGRRENIAVPQFDFTIYSLTPRQRLGP